MPYFLGRCSNVVNIAFKYKVSGNINLYLKTAFYNYEEDYYKDYYKLSILYVYY
jgi:hypothetical protein